MSNTLFFLLLALAAGAMMPVQAALNNKMAEATGSPILAALMSFLVGTVALIGAVLATTPMSTLAQMKNAPYVAWTAGLLGAFFVTSTVILLPRLGVALTFSLVVAGQMILTLIFDHYGLLGVPVKEISLPRLAGVVLICVGVVLIRKF